MVIKKHRIPYALVAAVLFLLAGCDTGRQPAPTASLTLAFRAQLTPYLPATVTPSPVQVTATAIPPAPTPTPTPRTHTVRQGEDMFGIALLYGVNLDELKTANPTIQPNFLSIGTVLLIPGTAVPQPEADQPGTVASPTAFPLELGQMACYPSADGGAWCFLPVRNPNDTALESLSARFRLGDEAGQELAAQDAYLPLDLLPPGAVMPLSAFFPPPLPGSLRGSAEIIRALPNPADGRYVATRLESQVILLAEDGLSAEVSGAVLLGEGEASAQRVWVAAVAYDAQGSVVGVRRWENPAGSTLDASAPMTAHFWIYSAAGAITRVELFSEARP